MRDGEEEDGDVVSARQSYIGACEGGGEDVLSRVYHGRGRSGGCYGPGTPE